jgi:hypothetical protein
MASSNKTPSGRFMLLAMTLSYKNEIFHNLKEFILLNPFHPVNRGATFERFMSLISKSEDGDRSSLSE